MNFNELGNFNDLCDFLRFAPYFIRHASKHLYSDGMTENTQTEMDEMPAPEDYIISDGRGCSYNVGQVEGKFLGEFKSYSEAQLAIREKMTAEQFYPNVWTVSDHGNVELVQLTV